MEKTRGAVLDRCGSNRIKGQRPTLPVMAQDIKKSSPTLGSIVPSVGLLIQSWGRREEPKKHQSIILFRQRRVKNAGRGGRGERE